MIKGVFPVVFFLLGFALFAQDAGGRPGLLGEEIRGLEQRLANAGISSAERFNALTRLAGLRQLSGDIAGAAANWLDAAAIMPGESGDAALVSGIYCLIAIGEWDRAVQLLHGFIVSGRTGPSVLRARYLDASLRTWIAAAAGGNDASALVALAADPEFAALRPTIYYTLWRTITDNPGITQSGSAEFWQARLLAAFPNSPEAILANPSSASPRISAVRRPHWLFAPGDAAVSVLPPQVPPSAAPPSVPPPVSPPVSPPPQTLPPPAASDGVSSAITGLQTGVFGREVNARSHADLLRRNGFNPAITPRTLPNGTVQWIVTVPPGQNPTQTANALRAAGFDNFPVR